MYELNFDPPATPQCETNYCDRRGAEELKADIEAYWSARGHSVHVWIEQRGFSSAMRGAYWVVRSDMRNALPSPSQIERAA